MSHTPGPWTVGVMHRDTVVADAKYSCQERHSGHDDVEYYGGLCIAESILPENRSLIAAAPNMLEALKILDNRGGLGLDVHEWIQGIIAKAEGNK